MVLGMSLRTNRGPNRWQVAKLHEPRPVRSAAVTCSRVCELRSRRQTASSGGFTKKLLFGGLFVGPYSANKIAASESIASMQAARRSIAGQEDFGELAKATILPNKMTFNQLGNVPPRSNQDLQKFVHSEASYGTSTVPPKKITCSARCALNVTNK